MGPSLHLLAGTGREGATPSELHEAVYKLAERPILKRGPVLRSVIHLSSAVYVVVAARMHPCSTLSPLAVLARNVRWEMEVTLLESYPRLVKQNLLKCGMQRKNEMS